MICCTVVFISDTQYVKCLKTEIVLFLLEWHLKMKQIVVPRLVHDVEVLQARLMKTGNGLA